MKNIVKNKVKSIYEKYKYNMLLMIIIFILFLTCEYSKNGASYTLFLKDKEVTLSHKICEINNEPYIHIDDLTNNFKDNIFDDKIAGKLIITTYNDLVKINKNDSTYTMIHNNQSYIRLRSVMEHIGNDLVVVKDKIYVIQSGHINGGVKKNRTELLDKATGDVLCLLQKQNQVTVYIDENIDKKTNKVVSVSAVVDGKTYYGYVMKNNIDYEYVNTLSKEHNKKIVLVKADKEIMPSTDTKYIDMVAINMYRLAGVDTLAKLDYTNNAPKTVDVLATINNGQKSSNYDVEIVTAMLNSEHNRNKIIEQIASGVKNISGVNLDFSNFKLADKDNYTQFVKELAAVMHKNNKIIAVNIPSTQYIDVAQIEKVVDYIILQPYYARTTSSKTSGAISPIAYVEQALQQGISQVKDVEKIILELPAYTILWTERRGTVINAEQYSMKLAQLYLKQNNLSCELDNVTGQNYINFTKGITTYKMWLEDVHSLTKKAEMASNYGLAGVSIFRSGMELNEIYESISKMLKK